MQDPRGMLQTLQDSGGMSQTGVASTSRVGTSPETVTFNPLGIREEAQMREEDIRGRVRHKEVVINRVIVCLAVCLFNTISYETFRGTELSKQLDNSPPPS
ncbi:hypothetical protein AMTRI_Chr09g18010 [Amborella trichopoda]